MLEFYVTPFDHAPADKTKAIPSQLVENKVIGMSWAVLDYDDEQAKHYAGLWNLSHKTTMCGNVRLHSSLGYRPPAPDAVLTTNQSNKITT